MERINIDMIRLDGGTQPRSKIDDKTVARYAAAMKNGDTFPPVAVFHDGSDHWLADGFHRVRAAQQVGAGEIDADVHQGALRDAVLFSVSVNMAHGVRRTPGDTRRSVQVLLSDPEWSQWGNMEIARRCGCSESYVRSLRKGASPSSHSAKMRTVKRKGSTFTQNTSRIGKSGGGTKETAGAGETARPPRIVTKAEYEAEAATGVSSKAMKPVRDSQPLPSKTALELPHDPLWAAKALISTFDREFIRGLVQALTNHLQGDRQ